MKSEQNRKKFKLLHEGIGLMPKDSSVLKQPDLVTDKVVPVESVFRLLPSQILKKEGVTANTGHASLEETENKRDRLPVSAAHLVDVFLTLSLFVTTWVVGFQLVRQSQPLVELFWKIARKIKIEWWLVERGVPEFLWPVMFWAVLLMIVVQSLFVMLGGATLGQTFFRVKLAQDGILERLGLLISETLGLFGVLSLFFVVVWPRRMPFLFWIKVEVGSVNPS